MLTTLAAAFRVLTASLPLPCESFAPTFAPELGRVSLTSALLRLGTWPMSSCPQAARGEHPTAAGQEPRPPSRQRCPAHTPCSPGACLHISCLWRSEEEEEEEGIFARDAWLQVRYEPQCCHCPEQHLEPQGDLSLGWCLGLARCSPGIQELQEGRSSGAWPACLSLPWIDGCIVPRAAVPSPAAAAASKRAGREKSYNLLPSRVLVGLVP